MHQCYLTNEENDFMMPNYEKRGDYYVNPCLSHFNTKKWWKEKLVIQSQSINVTYPNEVNDFIMPNHEKKGGYYMNLCLSQLTNEV